MQFIFLVADIRLAGLFLPTVCGLRFLFVLRNEIAPDYCAKMLGLVRSFCGHMWARLRNSVRSWRLYLYGTQRFITLFTAAHHMALYWVRWIQSMPSYHFPLRSILILCFLILSYHPRSLCHFLHFPVVILKPTIFHGFLVETPLNHFFPVMWATRCCKMRGKIVVPYDLINGIKCRAK
jgi:hypothetical protein